MLTRERVARGARRVRMRARRKNGRELLTLPRAPMVVTRRCVWRGRGGHKTVGTALRCSARKERGRGYSLVLQCADARPNPHSTALFPLSRRIYHRAYPTILSIKKNQRRVQNRHVADLKGVDSLLTRCVRGIFLRLPR